MTSYVHPSTKAKIDNLLKLPTHGYIFSGPQYMFKDETALSVAHQLTGGEHIFETPNIILIEPEENKSIKIGAVKKAREGLSLTAYDVSHPRVIIIRQADKLTTEAANALLKTLEEPHDNVIFILTTDRLSLLPATVRSRLQTIGFVRPNAEQLRDFFSAQDGVDSGSIERVVEQSNHLPRLAALLLQGAGNEQEIDPNDVERFFSGNLIERFVLVQKISKQSLHIAFLSALERTLSSHMTQSSNAFIAQRVIQARRYIDANVSPRLVLEHICLELEL